MLAQLYCRYAASPTLAAFSATARAEVDLTHLADNLVTVMDETMPPAHVSLWLRSREPTGPSAPCPAQT
jgi:hypothetical protein